MPIHLMSNRRTGANSSWAPQWKNISLLIPGLKNYFVAEFDCAYANKEFHLCFTNNTGRIYHLFRNAQDNWGSTILDIQALPSIGNIGTFVDVACAGNIEKLLYLCGVKSDGKIVVLFRSAPTTWAIKTLDLCTSTASPPLAFTRVTCALDSLGNLNIIGLTNTGKLYFARFLPNNTFSTMLDVATVSPYNVQFTDVSCSLALSPNNNLHVCAITSAKIYHSFRYNGNGNWQAWFGDVEVAVNSDLNGYHRIGVGVESNGKMHACMRMNNSKAYHTYRDTNGGWQSFFGDLGTISNNITNVMGIACDAWDDKLDVICTKLSF